MDKKVEQAYLYDFYGELLNEHQRRIYEDVVYNDMSLSEIAEEEGISRQGVSDMLKRLDKKLKGYEDKLHLLEKFLSIKAAVEEIHREVQTLAGDLSSSLTAEQLGALRRVEQLSGKIFEQL